MKIYLIFNKLWGSGWMSFDCEYKIIKNYMLSVYPDIICRRWNNSNQFDMYLSILEFEAVQESLIALGVTEMEIDWRGEYESN